jgi:nitrite reductase/ring-hydroxylating ferredoxin subunit
MLNPEISTNRRPIDRLANDPTIAELAERWQPIVQSALDAAGIDVQNALHGVFFGHPLHPALTDIPTGAWTVTAILDAAELAGVAGVATGSDIALAIGLAGATGAAFTGYAEWSDTSGEPRTLGMAHAMLNGVATFGYITSFGLRLAKRRRDGAIAAFVSYGVMALAAYLGGELSYGQQIGIRHTAEPLFPGDEFTPVLDAAELTQAAPVRADYNGMPLLISRTPDGIAAIGAACTHRGAPLDEGVFADGCVTCPWHGSVFSLADGAVRQGPAAFPQPRFDAREHGGKIEVRKLTSV